MLNPQFLEYLEKIRSLNKGASEGDMRLVLKASGWSPEEIEEGISRVRDSQKSYSSLFTEKSIPKSLVVSSPVVSKNRLPPVEKNNVVPSNLPGIIPMKEPASFAKDIRPPHNPIPDSHSESRKRTEFSVSNLPKPSFGLKITVYVAVAVVSVSSGGYFSLAYFNGFWPFKSVSEIKTDFFSKLLNNSLKIREFSFDFNLNVQTEPQDKDARPFSETNPSASSSVFANVPSDFEISTHLSGAVSLENQNADSNLSLEINLKTGGIPTLIKGDIIKKGSDVYLRLSEFPALSYPPAATIKGKWVRIPVENLGEDPTDIASLSLAQLGIYKSKSAFNREAALDAVKSIAATADKTGLAKAEKKEESQFDGATIVRYEIFVNREGLIKFLENIFSKLGNYQGSDLFSNFLESEESKRYFEYWKNNSTITVWLDSKEGYPVKAEYRTRAVPEDGDVALKDKQIGGNASAVLHRINVPVAISAPEKDILPYENVAYVFTGETKTVYQFKKQIENIKKIRNSLSLYKNETGKYPKFLSDLIFMNANDPSLVDMPAHGLEKIPADSYAGKAYKYISTADGYRLSYNVVLPPFKEFSYMNSLRLNWLKQEVFKTVIIGATKLNHLGVSNGVNTATEKTLSIEADSKSKKDSDNDGASDILENYIGTNKLKEDFQIILNY